MKVFLNRLYKNDVVFLYPDDYDLIAKLSDDEVEEIYEKKGYRLDTEEFLYLINVYSGKDYDKLRERMKQERLYFDYYGVSNIEYKFLNLCYKVLEDDDIFDKFLDFDNHLELFSFNNSFNQEDYLLEMIDYFEERKNFIKIKDIDVDLSFTDDKMHKKYLYLKSIIKVSDETRMDEGLRFLEIEGIPNSYHLQRYIDNDWKMDEGIRDYIYKDMDPNYNLEEKIAFIYLKLCLILEYEESYLLFDDIKSVYKKDIMEAITLNNPFVLCSDFSHIFTKLSNEYDGVDARSVRCGTDDRVHEYIIIFFKGKNYYVTFEPVETHGNFNDMTAVKLGQDLEGVKIINDETNSFKKTIDKVYSDLKNKKSLQNMNLLNNIEISI